MDKAPTQSDKFKDAARALDATRTSPAGMSGFGRRWKRKPGRAESDNG
jgi:hypothetical protein